MLIEPRVFRWNEKTIEIRSALPEDAKKLKDALEATDSDVAKFLAHVSAKVGHTVESVDGMTYDEYDVAIAAVNKKMERKG